MEYRSARPAEAAAVEQLFAAVFSYAEGEEEGTLIGRLARELMTSTADDDIHVFVAVADRGDGSVPVDDRSVAVDDEAADVDRGKIVGAVILSRLTFDPPLTAFILAPVAVHHERQGRGIGQALITHGLQELKAQGVRFVATYGDPAFYSKVGFRPIAADVIQPPYRLSQPEGWLGQSLTDAPLGSISGRCACVKALDDPVYW